MKNPGFLNSHSKYPLFVLLLLLLFACKKEGNYLFQMAEPKETGLTFTNAVEESDALNILDYLYFYNGGGVAIGDVNNDGLPDIFLSGNQVKNRLYLNKGGLKFQDISAEAGISGNSTWNTGAVMGDVNGDGLLDIYVCAVVGINGFKGYNELFINNGDLSFTEKAGDFGLDFDTFSSNAAFLDYDLDGDLDLYLLNHAVHTQESFGKASLRYSRDDQTGDKLLRNDNGTFTDVSEEAGIYGGINGYGLGVAIADFNDDGYPDIYVGNDFHEDDYYYLNNGDGTFTESLKTYFDHITRFSMGNDVADVNNDGLVDILSLDMLPEEETVLKASEGDDNIQTQRMRTEGYGYHYQFTRNMLHINSPTGEYVETALMSGVAATDWSWSSLFGDFNQDGVQDLFIANGIPKRPNDLDFINFVSSDQIRKKINNTKLVDQDALELMPSGRVHNYIFQGSDSLVFSDRSGQWIPSDTLVSGASAYGDLDLDGDLDLVVNNFNSPVSLYVNQGDKNGNYLKLYFDYPKPNTQGIGTKAIVYTDGGIQYKELYTVRGFQASSEPVLHFGLGANTVIDSLKIIWPDMTSQVLRDVKINQQLTVIPRNTLPVTYPLFKHKSTTLFKKLADNLGIHYTHEEDNYVDFNRQKLIPYKISDRGPATALGDLNGDGKTDIFFGSSKFKPARVFIQQDSLFQSLAIEAIGNDSINEEVAAVIRDFNGDGRSDLYLGTGGGDFYGKMDPLRDKYLVQTDSGFVASEAPEVFGNTSVIAPADVDEDGDLDLFVGQHARTNDFGNPVSSGIYRNDKGTFRAITGTTPIEGMITDAFWMDLNGDGDKDLIVCGEWMPPTVYFMEQGSVRRRETLGKNLSGLWQAITPFDIDGDGDQDLLLGNWGLNTKFKASADFPLKAYYGDFDENGSTETIICIERQGKYYPIEDLNGLSSQLVFLRKKYNQYRDFAGKTIEEILGKDAIAKARILEVEELRSGYLLNNKGKFSFVPFPRGLQVAPVTAFLEHDFDADGTTEALAAGNYFGVKPYHGRFGSFGGAMIKGKNDVILGADLGLELMRKSARDLNIITVNNQPYLLITYNDAKAEVYAF